VTDEELVKEAQKRSDEIAGLDEPIRSILGKLIGEVVVLRCYVERQVKAEGALGENLHAMGFPDGIHFGSNPEHT